MAGPESKLKINMGVAPDNLTDGYAIANGDPEKRVIRPHNMDSSRRTKRSPKRRAAWRAGRWPKRRPTRLRIGNCNHLADH